MMRDERRAEMLAVNDRQRNYYEVTDGGSVSHLNSFATNLWRLLRSRAQDTISKEARELPYEIHKDWLGDLSDKRVLDLGAGHGSPLSIHLAMRAREYHAIDLSASQLDLLRSQLTDQENAKFMVADFLSDDFSEAGYDVIYAHSVFHHFRYPEVLFDKVCDCLSDDGVVVTIDPLQTWLPARLFRLVFRPFQTDAAWEFPFGLRQVRAIEDHFEVKDRFGIFGRAKWAFAMGMVTPALGKRNGDRLFSGDFETDYVRKKFYKCLVASYLLGKRLEKNAQSVGRMRS